jgi:dienelactone hydrolase
MGPYGTYDMAGNVKEWVASSLGSRRYLLGGAWDDDPHMFSRYEAKSSWSREQTIGFRLVRRVPAQEAASDELVLEPDSVDRGQPVDDHTYQLFERYHAYDKTDLEARIEHTIELPYGRRETVSFRTAYGTERMKAHLFLPRDSKPPHQIVVLFGHAGILSLRSIDDLRLPIEFVVRSARALVIPEYFGTLDRGPSQLILPPLQERDRNLNWSKDLGRSLDYLETRPADFDISKLAFYGVSLGAGRGPRLIAVEHRFTAAVLVSGGMYDHEVPEVNVWNFLPRVKIPVLMLNGRDDFIYPVDTHQRPLFEALGTKEPDKMWRQYDGGHANLVTRPDVVSEILKWLDKYLGTVDRRP